ncbi:DUF455 domain-containing protein (endonuclease/exonuclease/phosphatase) [Colletotrichum plurivorum]|uniref:polynucleotide adenylyltransferase n=1 Tax=Colletotrichum plurivorum TaxID=2175906 RepID=A0A8H6MX78_9PEZI|nr:DUF455 domain-containing protein (endonuclease/exonuclease/phosphatase) [Colletotrichum plurivorum]
MDASSSRSYDTALCLIPPREQWPLIERLRLDNDKAYSKWPPHINLIYPFVKCTDSEDLQRACHAVASSLENCSPSHHPNALPICLDSTGVFSHRHGSTVFLCDNDEKRLSRLVALRDILLKAIGQNRSGSFNMHMTMAQCDDAASSPRIESLLGKLRRLPPICWEASQLAVLVRSASGQMQQWRLIDLISRSLTISKPPPIPGRDVLLGPITQRTWHFSKQSLRWCPVHVAGAALPLDTKPPENLVIASWNVLAEFSHPPSHARYPLILENLLSGNALADVLVLQEVTDDFLQFLLADERIVDLYHYVTEGSPDDLTAGPLPNILNSVVLSRYPFKWEYLPSRRQHKGFCVLEFQNLGQCEVEEPRLPLVIATCHLTRGLTDGAVVAKDRELQRILGHLKDNYAANPWVIVGDFNLATSAYTIDASVKRGAITAQTKDILCGIETKLAEAGLLDAWMVSRVEAGVSDNIKRDANDVFEGEQGATFDPIENPNAAKMVGSGLNNRPQRYDRILVKSGGPLHISRFNNFGFITGEGERAGDALYASDHWGIRCLLQRSALNDSGTGADVVPVQLKRALGHLTDIAALKRCLERLDVIPTDADEDDRRQALELLQEIILENEPLNLEQTRGRPVIVMVPVGSYGLGVWSKSSDMDCLCIGSISPRVFFALARQRLRRAAGSGVRVLRKVKARTGTMLEVEVLGLKCDLQYCQAADVASLWPDLMKRPPSDPAFSLPTQTLLKLKPARDLFYLQRSVPDLAQFRLCYRVIKTWAKSRGIYAARFGYLGGIHLSVMLARLCKMLLHDGGAVSTTDIVTTFFHHYSQIDWKNDIIFDPFFHRQLRYHRTSREAMCLLGWHSPILNTAVAASVPTVEIISNEFNLAEARLQEEGATWNSLLPASTTDSDDCMTAAAATFLASFPMYIDLRIHYWGDSLERGIRLVGWLESRCASLLVDIHRRVPGLVARIWPARFVETVSEDLEAQQTDYQGSYLIGLKWMTGSENKPKRDEWETVQSNLRAALQQFEQHIHGDEQYYDPSTSWFSALLVRAGELGDLKLDNREWGVYLDGDDESDTEDEEEQENDALQQSADRNGKAKAKAKRLRPMVVANPESAGKFRTALDVLNRLRWDPQIDSSDFLIGYEDRFLGPQEKALSAWKSEQTDEEFIPQHRILWFKRQSDGLVVWHRSRRIDLLFRKLEN